MSQHMIEMDTYGGRQVVKICASSGRQALQFYASNTQISRGHAWTPRSHYFGVHAQNFGVRDAGTHLNGIAACLVTRTVALGHYWYDC
jgi:hypothetical protein